MEAEVAEGLRVIEDFGRYSAGVLGYPVDFTGPLTAYEIAELGSGLVSFPSTKRRRIPNSPLPSPTESAEDEAAVLDRTPMRGVLQTAKGAAPARPRPADPRPPPRKRAVHPAEQRAAEMPPIGWEHGTIAILDTPTQTAERPERERPAEAAEAEPYYVGALEQDGVEFKSWQRRMLATVVREHAVGGVIRHVESPLVEVGERFRVQNVGSARVFTRTVRAEAARKAQTRAEIRAGGLTTDHFRALGATAPPPAERKPEWDVSNLRHFSLPPPSSAAGAGRYAVFRHSTLNPPRRCVLRDPTAFTGVLPASAATAEDKKALGICRRLLPVEFPVARANKDCEHPGLAPVAGFELWADTPAGRSIAAVAPCTDFLVTASGRVLGPIECAVTLGQIIPKSDNLNDRDLRLAAEKAYHNAIVEVFFPDPYGPPATPTLVALLAPWHPL